MGVPISEREDIRKVMALVGWSEGVGMYEIPYMIYSRVFLNHHDSSWPAHFRTQRFQVVGLER
jgi:hypothetical protein